MDYTISTICGVAAAAVVLLLLVAVITYKLTKQCVQKELLKSLSQSLDISPISCEVDFPLCRNSFTSECIAAVNKTCVFLIHSRS